MKKVANFIRKLSITQQLLGIVVFTTAFFLIFFFGIISSNINRFVDIQMYDVIHRSQENIIYDYQIDIRPEHLFGPYDKDMSHIIYREGRFYISSSLTNVDNELVEFLDANVERLASMTQNDFYYKKTSLYTVTAINEIDVLVTIMSQQYQNEFKNLLLNNIINMMMVIMVVVFSLLLIWVLYIIHPLNLIKEYINRIRRNENVTLRVDRDDEIGALARVLVEMHDELKRQEKLKEEMIQNISHDLKTPIATIKSYGESIKDGIYPYETLEKSVDVIIEHAERLEKKVFNLLMLNRMDYMTNELQDIEQEFQLAPVIEHVIVSTNQFRPEINFTLNAKESSTFNGSEEPWRVVIENLLDNALRYAKSEIIINVKDGYCSVYNDGSSIDQEKASGLFKAYEMGEGGQFGLGLAIVNRVTSNYGYHVDVHNIRDGVEFVIRKGVKHE